MADLTPPRVPRAATPTEVQDGSIVDNGDGTVTVTIGLTTFTIAGGRLVTASLPPANATATGIAGSITWDANFVYVCVATNTWKRAALATW